MRGALPLSVQGFGNVYVRTCHEAQAFLSVWSSLVLYCQTPLMTVGDNGLYSSLNHVCFNRGFPAQRLACSHDRRCGLMCRDGRPRVPVHKTSTQMRADMLRVGCIAHLWH